MTNNNHVFHCYSRIIQEFADHGGIVLIMMERFIINYQLIMYIH